MSTSDASTPKREPVDVQGLRELCERATPGPWEIGKRVSPGQTFDHEINIFPPDTTETHGFQYGGPVCVAQDCGEAQDAEFIAAARTALPACLDLIEELDTSNQRWIGQAVELRKDVDALRAALEGVAGRRNGGPLCWCGTRFNDHADYCKRATAALEQPAAQSSERAK